MSQVDLAELARVLVRVFSPDELRWWIILEIDWSLHTRMPLGASSREAYVLETVTLLEREGLINERFFRALAEARPAIAPDIRALTQSAEAHRQGQRAEATRHASDDGCSPARLRAMLMSALATDAEFDAFCHDHHRDVWQQFSDGMQRTRKITLLLSMQSPQSVLQSLRAAYVLTRTNEGSRSQ